MNKNVGHSTNKYLLRSIESLIPSLPLLFPRSKRRGNDSLRLSYVVRHSRHPKVKLRYHCRYMMYKTCGTVPKGYLSFSFQIICPLRGLHRNEVTPSRRPPCLHASYGLCPPILITKLCSSSLFVREESDSNSTPRAYDTRNPYPNTLTCHLRTSGLRLSVFGLATDFCSSG